jgi:signal transduction histidine kinase
MSHELRTPLNAIIGFTELLLEGTFGELNATQLEYLEDIKDSAEYQYDMISSILDISKIESGQVKLNLQKFSLNSIIDQVKSSLKPLYKNKNLEFEVEGLDRDLEIYADPIRFKEILLNLLTNAIKFTIEGYVKLIIKEFYDRWIFKIRDTGIGIARKDFDLIFKEFKRVESSYVKSTQGTGLGLSLTKRLVNLHGGQITFSSVLGVGTTFTFFIPKNIPKETINILK